MYIHLPSFCAFVLAATSTSLSPWVIRDSISFHNRLEILDSLSKRSFLQIPTALAVWTTKFRT